MCDYDEYDSFVVVAESAFGAEQLVKGSIPWGEYFKRNLLYVF